MRLMSLATKAQLVIDIIKQDPYVDKSQGFHFDNDSNPTQILFNTTDPVSDEELGTGYWSDKGYDWNSTGYFTRTTIQKLQQLGIPDSHIQGNNCEGCENEYCIFLA